MVGTRNERGQTMIQLALALVVLMGIGALAVDVGMGYLERRRMQNAADAGALAGAYALCKAEPADVAKAKAVEYMQKNGVKAADIAAGDVTISGGAVSVVAKTSIATNLAGSLGFSTLDVGAASAATCGAANSACGLWPIAFDLALYVYAACGERMVIWADDSVAVDSSCEIGGVTRPFCDCYECDYDGPIVIFPDLGRAWLDFSGSVDPVYPDTCQKNGCGESEMECRIRSGSSAPITLPACIAGLRGVKAGAKNDIDNQAGDVVKIPLYDGTCDSATNHCTGKDAAAFNIVKFGCVTVEGWVQTLQLDPTPLGAEEGYKRIKSKAIVVTKYCGGDCTTSCGSTDGTLPQPWELTSVSLTK